MVISFWRALRGDATIATPSRRSNTTYLLDTVLVSGGRNEQGGVSPSLRQASLFHPSVWHLQRTMVRLFVSYGRVWYESRCSRVASPWSRKVVEEWLVVVTE